MQVSAVRPVQFGSVLQGVQINHPEFPESYRNKGLVVPAGFTEVSGHPIMLSKTHVQDRVIGMAEAINNFYSAKKVNKLLIVGIAEGAIPFMWDLAQHLRSNCDFVTLKVNSYVGPKQSEVKINAEQLASIPNRLFPGDHVLIVDDIIDTGHTITRVKQEIEKLKPGLTINTAVLLDKAGKRAKDVQYEPDFIGFVVPNAWLGGRGMNFLPGAPWRNLKNIVYQ